MEEKRYSEISAHKIQTPGNHPNERMQHSEHDESLESRGGQIPASVDSPPKEREI